MPCETSFNLGGILLGKSLVQRAREGVLGALIGDALGVPHEFKRAEQIPLPQDILLIMSADYKRSHPGVPYGTWSDDGSQMMCLLDSLARYQGSLNLEDFAAQLLAWRDQAWHQAGGRVYDCGSTTRGALDQLRAGILPVEAGETHDRSLGNGSLMRVLPAALAPVLWGVSEAEALSIALRQSRVTHAHPVAQVTCAVHTQFAMLLLNEPALDMKVAMHDALAIVEQHTSLATPSMQAALQTVRNFEREMPTGSGYAVSTLWTAAWALERSDDYLSAVRNAISLGGDTDTLACVTGGLAGIRYGLGVMEKRWLTQMQVPDESSVLIHSLFGEDG